jgi:hypothetical protein
MKVLTTKAIFIAHAGAEKIRKNGGYTWERSQFNEARLTVINEEGKRYSLVLDRPGRRGWCACPFFVENGICKHKIWAGEEVDAEDNWIAENETRIQTIADERGDVLEQGGR